ncbi:archaetidylserine decarboxylase [Merismopedia glauca]|uniref:phosphatidylserine decarboxylase n=1 Tax=Merismopedia glauca CCAP 1448/3 TaxID=1296344 RepID=A0A2T1C4D5_9CYAN|nr:archaetidylserine decarboxylase [Merismopedia glauca]PSB03018.1 phosphatidylserine decarboxylase [Merismopedia glauca CCAP 1448/3]
MSFRKILYRDRLSGELITEQIFQENILRWLYETYLGYLVWHVFLNRKIFNVIYGKYQDSSYSRHQIYRFVAKYEIDPTELILPLPEYSSFNAFFCRQLKPSVRPFIADDNTFCAPGDGKILVCSKLKYTSKIPVKNQFFSLDSLLGSSINSDIYIGGNVIILRLAPYDYHRFHFPDSGIAESAKYIKGEYHSVNPIALNKVPDIYCRNQRAITQFNSDNFGSIAYIEIGALTVSSIIQTYKPGRVNRGQEKGYFQYGGSTIILLFEPGKILFDSDLLQDSIQGIEVAVLAGSRLGKKIEIEN